MKVAARWMVILCLLLANPGWGQQTRYDSFTSYSIFSAYANDSSHILVGRSEDQRLALFGGDWNVREAAGKWTSLHYELEVLPAAVLISPYLVFTQDVTYFPNATQLPFAPPGLNVERYISDQRCYPFSGTGILLSISSNGAATPIGTNVYSNRCSHAGTYAGGLSPIGQKLNFLPRQKVQPFLVLNGGFLVFTRNIPVPDATRFNFTAEFGGGVEWFVRPRHSWSLDARFHHTSNAFRGADPGIDNIMVRLSYTFSRSSR